MDAILTLVTLAAVTFFVDVKSKSTFDLLVMGDFGGSDEPPYTTPQQLDTARIMGIVANQYNVDQVWSVGDNLYEDGVADVSSPRFNTSFESVFTAESLMDIPYYLIAGNHDYHLSVEAQITYSNRSKRWNFHNYYYNYVFIFGEEYEMSLEMVMIDTVMLVGQSYGTHPDDIAYCKQHNISNCSDQPSGPDNKTAANEQYLWIENTLSKSTASYLFVVGHYPIWSVGEHGPTNLLVQNLNPMLIKYNVTAYISGHEHTFAYFKTDNIGYPITGGAHECESFSTNHTNDNPYGSLLYHQCVDGGFVRFRCTKNQVDMYFYTDNKTISQFNATLYPR
eukprot:308334_1